MPRATTEIANQKPERRTQAARRGEAEGAILEAAIRIISEQGVERLTLADVGEAAGYSRGLPAHYFGSKEGLITAVADQIIRDFRDDVVRSDRHPQGLDQLISIATLYFDAAERYPVRTKALFVILGTAFYDEALNVKIAALNSRSVQTFVQNIKAGIAAGDIRKSIDAEVHAALILSGLRGASALWLVNPKALSLKRLQAEFLAALKERLQP